jgi:xanthine/uracil/vitamin C permease (AzgA family)
MYLVSLYVLGAAPIWQAGACPGCTERLNVTSPAGYTDAQFRTLPAAVALAGGISTIFMGLYGNMPIIVAPGISGIYFQQLAVETSPGCAQAASLIVGLFIFAFALMSKKIKIISSTPEDFRLGVAAGKGGLIALIALRNCGLVSPEGTAFVADFNYNVILALLGFAIIIISQQKGFLVFSFIGTIVIISTLSLIIRGATNTTIVGSLQGALPDLSLVAKPPTFDDFSYDNGFFIAQFVIRATFHNLIDIVATVTALVLMSVVRFRFGYDKESFTSVLSESSKCFQIFVSIGLCQVLVSPFLGVSPVSLPF